VTLQLQWKHQFQFAGYYMAKEKGFYDDVNLNVSFLEHTKETNSIQDVLSKKVNYATGRASLINKRSHGKNVVLLSALLQSSPLALATKESSGITMLKDLKNKRLTMTGNEAETSIFPLLLSQKITQKDLIINFSKDKVNDLINNKTDIITLYTSNQEYSLIQKNIKYKIFHPKDFYFDFYDDILYTSEEESVKNRARTLDFTQASLKGWEYAFNNIDETIKIILKYYNTQNKSYYELLYEANTLKKLAYKETNKLGEIDKTKIQRIYDIYHVMGLTQNPINLDKFIFNVNKISSTNLHNNKKTLSSLYTQEELNYLKNHKVIKMCNNPSWEPIEFAEYGDMDKMSGIAIDTIHKIENNLQIRFQTIPTTSWTQSQEFLRDKKCDILPSAIKTKQRETYANFTQSYLNLPLAIFTRKDKPLVNGLSEIIEETWSRQKGSGLIHKMEQDYPNNQLIITDTTNEAFQFVNNGTSYFTIATLPVASTIIHKYQLDNLQIAGYSNIIYNLSIAVRKDAIILRNILDKALQEIPKKEHQNILKSWINTDENSIFNSKVILNIFIGLLILTIFLSYRQYLLKKNNSNLKDLIDEKTKELKELNLNLEVRITKAINENRKKDKILDAQSKMVSMGEMIGNIAHQWRQPLSVISTGVTGMQVQKEYGLLDDEQFNKTCETINENAQYLSKTIDDFKNFIQGDREKRYFNLFNSLNRFIHLVEGSIKEHDIKIIIDIDKKLEINSYENELSQCLINIFNNAKDALKENEITNKFIFISAYKQDDYLILNIQDNALGIKQEIIEKIFEPYFTTKHKFQGTGLGLNMTYKLIVEGMKGTITVQNNTFLHNNISYTGALFQIKLPIN
ncbi:ABC transporter substrate-binding protein, partial [Arcobacteraceae bacterium]|nr:ABC transporter substrate-binding protein [Arcobacteraceae bacterium]